MGEFRIGSMLEALNKTSATVHERHEASMAAVALKIEEAYKEKLGEGGSHDYGSPTPATPGNGPAIISGQLRRSATHEKVETTDGTEYRIGPASTPRAPYSGTAGSHKTRTGRTGSNAGNTATNGEVGMYLETGLRNGATYPALKPAAEEGTADTGDTFRTEFSKGGWETGV